MIAIWLAVYFTGVFALLPFLVAGVVLPEEVGAPAGLDWSVCLLALFWFALIAVLWWQILHRLVE